ncbi:MAG: GreA/GreB family elongation factor, partial [Deltaproteobacteria bacterium]|nr:GreA/GreB family elongation factor [Deltaproteobacteria bacterium]
GGGRVEVAGETVTAVTTSSPLGQALVGKSLDDDVDTRTPQGKMTLVIVAIG